MRWSLKIGRFAGIDVYVHATFFLLILWVIALHALEGRNPQAVISGVGFILALFACVVGMVSAYAKLIVRQVGPLGHVGRLGRRHRVLHEVRAPADHGGSTEFLRRTG